MSLISFLTTYNCLLLQMFTELQQMRQQLPDMEFGRRMAVERELEKVDGIRLTNIIFDETGHFVLYGTMLGIKVINVETNRYADGTSGRRCSLIELNYLDRS